MNSYKHTWKALPLETPIALLLSGGVDSSVALAFLKEKGFTNITAFYLKIWLEDDLHFLGDCPWEEDLDYASRVCQQLNIPLEVLSFQQEYYDKVVSYALSELEKGHTPSPDLFCNQRIKFGAFYEKISQRFSYIATGHYAQLLQGEDSVHLYKGVDPIKDQTYFLAQLSQEQLKNLLFPLGHLKKDEVRTLAQTWDLPTKDRKDSQGICFLGKMNYPDFVKHYLGSQEGSIIERETQKELGKHQGYWFHTIGQRQGLGLGNGPWFVVGKNPQSNVVFVSKQLPEERAIHVFYAKEMHLLNINPLKMDELECKLRHGKHTYPCKLKKLDETSYEVSIVPGDTGIAPGQFSVFYHKTECLGSGVIELMNHE